MSDSKRLTMIGEERVERAAESVDAATAIENEYWAEEGIAVPSEEQGCIRRGACCRSGPGWFGPGEVEAAAAHLGLEPNAFAGKYLIIDSIEHPEHGTVEAFAPLKLDRHGRPALAPLSRADNLYRYLKGPCIFFRDNGCQIYPVRPVECRVYFCGHDPEKNLTHEEVAEMWISGRVASPKLTESS